MVKLLHRTSLLVIIKFKCIAIHLDLPTLQILKLQLGMLLILLSVPSDLQALLQEENNLLLMDKAS